MKFYGTGAAEGIPNPFCGCYLCEYARKHGGKDVRTRSMFRLTPNICIDMGPDALMQSMLYGDLKEVEHVFITHTHEDHFASHMMEVRDMATDRKAGPMHYYFTGDGYQMIKRFEDSDYISSGHFKRLEDRGVIECHQLDYGKTYMIGGVEVTPLKGNHFGNMKENAANYLMKLADGRVVYYGCDTGPYLDETFEALKHAKIDILISECTYGGGEDSYPNPGHLSHTACVKVFKQLLAQGTIDSHTKVYLTHINHCHTADHETLQKLFDESGLPMQCTVAYDGLEII